ncbi:MAG: hypothetical protein RL095_1691 [Verrucomicrobiota bacterium]|jgi:1,4-dihydroxy-2-naphthoate octaprenyltransferase
MKYAGDSRLVNWLRVMRVSQGFFFISGMPVALGAWLIWYHHGERLAVSPGRAALLCLLAMLGALIYHLAADMLNDVWDHRSGADAQANIATPFSGGSKVIEEGKLAADTVEKVAHAFLLTGALLSVLIAWLAGDWRVLYFSAAGLISCWGYSAPPLKFCYRGLGEIVIFLNNGLLVMGALSMALLHAFVPELILPSCFLGFLGFAIITANEIPDYEGDRAVAKMNLVARLGVERALVLHKLAIVAAFLCLAAACCLKHLPWPALAALLAFLPAWNSVWTAPRHDGDLRDPAWLSCLCKATIKLKFHAWALALATALAWTVLR